MRMVPRFRHMSSLRGCDDYTARDDKRSSNQDRKRRGVFENQPGNKLGDDKKENDINADEFSKVPRRCVDSPAVREQDHGPKRKQRRALPLNIYLQSGSD